MDTSHRKVSCFLIGQFENSNYYIFGGGVVVVGGGGGKWENLFKKDPKMRNNPKICFITRVGPAHGSKILHGYDVEPYGSTILLYGRTLLPSDRFRASVSNAPVCHHQTPVRLPPSPVRLNPCDDIGTPV